MKQNHFKQVRFHGVLHSWKCLHPNTTAQCKTKLLLYAGIYKQQQTLSVRMLFAPALQGTCKAPAASDIPLQNPPALCKTKMFSLCQGSQISVFPPYRFYKCLSPQCSIIHLLFFFLPCRLGDFMCQDDLAEVTSDLDVQRVLANVPHKNRSAMK